MRSCTQQPHSMSTQPGQSSTHTLTGWSSLACAPRLSFRASAAYMVSRELETRFCSSSVSTRSVFHTRPLSESCGQQTEGYCHQRLHTPHQSHLNVSQALVNGVHLGTPLLQQLPTPEHTRVCLHDLRKDREKSTKCQKSTLSTFCMACTPPSGSPASALPWECVLGRTGAAPGLPLRPLPSPPPAPAGSHQVDCYEQCPLHTPSQRSLDPTASWPPNGSLHAHLHWLPHLQHTTPSR